MHEHYLRTRASELLQRVMDGTPGAYGSVLRLRAQADAGDPLAREAFDTMAGLYRERVLLAPPQVVEMYERLEGDDPTSWKQLYQIASMAQAGDVRSREILATLRRIYQERKASPHRGAPTTRGYSMPVYHRAGIAPPIIVGAGEPAFPGLPPGGFNLPPGFPQLPPGFPQLPPGFPQLPAGLPAKIPENLLLPLTEQVFEMLLNLIRKARTSGGLDRERATVVPMEDEPLGPARARPMTSTTRKALAVDPYKQRTTQLTGPMYAPTARIIQKLSML